MKMMIFKITKTQNWTEQEDFVLLSFAKNYERNNWKGISFLLKNKSPQNCLTRFQKINPIFRKGFWTEEEDCKLLILVKKLGENWKIISKEFKNRSGKQIRDRFKNFLDHYLIRKNFTLDEDLKILELHKRYGNCWSCYKKHFPDRSADMIKNRFNSSIKNKIQLLVWIKTLDDKAIITKNMTTNTNNVNTNNNEQFGVKLNNIQSSLKFFNFEGMSQDKIIEKYEETLCQREKQIRDLSYEIGIINEKLVNTNDRIKVLEEENQMLHNKILKKDTLLDQELTNKDIMFIKVNNLQNENDRLMKILQENGISLSSNNTNSKERKSFFSNMFEKFGNGGNKKTNDYNNNSGKSIQMNTKKEEDIKYNKDNSNHNSTNVNKDGSANKTTNGINSSNKQTTQNTLTSSISDTLTQEMLNNINLSIKREDGHSKLKSDSNSHSNNTSSPGKRNININSVTNPLGRLSLQNNSRDKRLASENVDYEPVFK